MTATPGWGWFGRVPVLAVGTVDQAGGDYRATLARLGIRWKRAKTWITSPDPAYARNQNSATVSSG